MESITKIEKIPDIIFNKKTNKQQHSPTSITIFLANLLITLFHPSLLRIPIY